MRKFICIFLCVVLMFCTFSLTAFADTDTDDDLSIFDFIASYYSSIYFENNIASDPDKLIDFYSTTPGKLITSLNLYRVGGALPSYVVQKRLDESLNEAVESRYIASEVDKSLVDDLYENANSIQSVRFNNLSDVHLSTSDSIDPELIEHVGGAITACGSSWYDPGDNYYKVKVKEHCISFYRGGNAPPAFYVPWDCVMYQDGIALPSGRLYFVVGDNLLISLPSDAMWSQNTFDPLYYGGLTADSITFGIQAYYGYESLEIYSSGVITGHTNLSPWDGWSCVQLFENMAGFVIDVDQTMVPDPITPPEYIPYDDNDKVIVLVPIDEPGEPVYMSPTTYNNYVNEGDIYNTDDHSNNVVDNSIVNNLSNIYNNYNSNSGGYDDTNLMNKLDTILDKLDRLINKKDRVSAPDVQFYIGDLLGVDDVFSINDIHLDWSSLIRSKLPLLAEAAEVVRSFKESNSPLNIESDVPLPFPVGDKKTIHFAINFTWYDTNKYNGKTGREYVREGLSYIIYLVAFVALYRRTDSIFFDL